MPVTTFGCNEIDLANGKVVVEVDLRTFLHTEPIHVFHATSKLEVFTSRPCTDLAQGYRNSYSASGTVLHDRATAASSQHSRMYLKA